MVAFGVLGGEDTDVGDDLSELARRLRDNPLRPYQEHNALNHTMVYLVMGHDDAKGTLQLRTNALDPNGKLEIDWDDVGRQLVFTRINEELRRHARALGAHFIENPVWHVLDIRHLLTAHPLGECPLGENHLQGAVDEFGRVFEGVGHSLLLADVQVFHRSPPSHYSDGKRTMKLKQEGFSWPYPVSACRPAHGTPGQ
jgi:hypothetical protein